MVLFLHYPHQGFLPPLLGKNSGSAKEFIFQYSVHTTLSNIFFPQSNNLDKPPSPEKRALESYRKEGGDIKREVEGNPPLYWNVERRGEKVKSKNYDSSSSFLFSPLFFSSRHTYVGVVEQASPSVCFQYGKCECVFTQTEKRTFFFPFRQNRRGEMFTVIGIQVSRPSSVKESQDVFPFQERSCFSHIPLLACSNNGRGK